ncbi:MAG: SDR family NAD(P)-dependent oxidoreductase [Lachnospiraceae bacterium]|nr:SDR family NAD(P)-dependent oxidoreductase [Lachnospiraceae bacterium]
MIRKHALITGASRGIGRALALEFAANGYDVTVTCLKNTEMLRQLSDDIKAQYRVDCRTFTGDLAEYENTDELFRDIDRLDVLINNAGLSYHGLTQDMSPGDWDHIISSNLSSAFYTSRLAIPLMLKQKKGKILNISSVWGEHGASMEVAYSASKGGLNAFTKALAKELAPSNIQVNAIACGMMDTDMNSIFNKEELNEIISDIPADRMGQPVEAARLAMQICTGNDYLTGQIITLDGGWI